mmetsp:Transcript_5627/g.18642  ORF Transcript_5627/g.18642 Transcript_5627/m.18642 type:complete len:163 (-) Transcript_5627:565-1053(-)
MLAVTAAAISFASETEPADLVVPPKWWSAEADTRLGSSYFGDTVDPSEACCKIVPLFNVEEYFLRECCCNMDIDPPVCQYIAVDDRLSPLSLTKDTFDCNGVYPRGYDLPLDDCDSVDECKAEMKAKLQSCEESGKCAELKEKSIEKLKEKVKENFPLLGVA